MQLSPTRLCVPRQKLLGYNTSHRKCTSMRPALFATGLSIIINSGYVCAYFTLIPYSQAKKPPKVPASVDRHWHLWQCMRGECYDPLSGHFSEKLA